MTLYIDGVESFANNYCPSGSGSKGPGQVTAPPPQVPCWRQVRNITATFVNLGTDIENDVAGCLALRTCSCLRPTSLRT